MNHPEVYRWMLILGCSGIAGMFRVCAEPKSLGFRKTVGVVVMSMVNGGAFVALAEQQWETLAVNTPYAVGWACLIAVTGKSALELILNGFDNVRTLTKQQSGKTPKA